MNAEAYAAHHREWHAGLLSHVAGKVHEQVHQQCTDCQGQYDLPTAQAQGIQADSEGVVGDVMDVVGPQGKQAVVAPATALGLGGCQVVIVQTGAQGHGRICC
ncbi:hypothetical protein D9M71_708090 [compost metagenome]